MTTTPICIKGVPGLPVFSWIGLQFIDFLEDNKHPSHNYRMTSWGPNQNDARIYDIDEELAIILKIKFPNLFFTMDELDDPLPAGYSAMVFDGMRNNQQIFS